ncbi:MAG: UDP-glucose dehydrogenase family protein [Candidatus Thorarchaeota archaeon]
MRVLIVGAGWVGITMSVLFSSSHKVTLLDIDEQRIEQISVGETPIVEPGITEGLLESVKEGLIRPVLPSDTIGYQDVIVICVGTPESPDGQVDLQYIESAINTILSRIDELCYEYCVVVLKSTVPPGTTRSFLINQVKENQLDDRVGIVFNPEFLREGSALADASNPDRVVIGAIDDQSFNQVRTMYEQVLLNKSTPYLSMSPESAELCKYASNSFLAMKISFSNEIANVAESVPYADIDDVMRGVGADHRITAKFFGSGAGFGGSCFPKDIQGLVRFAEERSIQMPLLRATQQVNSQRPKKLVDMLVKKTGNLHGKKITLLGLAFKPGTNDIRESPTLRLLDLLLELGAKVWIHDPLVTSMDVSKHLRENATISAELEECMRESHGCILVTDWPIYLEIGLENLTRFMSKRVLIDGRRVFATQTTPNDVFYQTVGIQALESGKE